VAACPICKTETISRVGGRFFCENCGKPFIPDEPTGTQASLLWQVVALSMSAPEQAR
jgi:ribosomal protein L37AE/L43A